MTENEKANVPVEKEGETPETAGEQMPPEEKAAENPTAEKEKAAGGKKHAHKPSKEHKALEEAEKKITELEKELGNQKDQLLRTMAEFDNFRKRTQKEKEDIYPFAVANTAEAFLPLIDNFERALSFDASSEEFKKGIEMISAQMGEILKKIGIEAIDPVGQPFNPDEHNAVMHVEDENFGENIVCEVFQKGYRIGDRIIRCAMVKVAN